MPDVAGVFDAQAFVVLIIALVGLIPVLLYRKKSPRAFLLSYGFLFIAAFATNFENLFLPRVLNFTEHLLGNMGAGVAFFIAAYVYRRRSVTATDGQTGGGGDETAAATPESGEVN